MNWRQWIGLRPTQANLASDLLRAVAMRRVIAGKVDLEEGSALEPPEQRHLHLDMRRRPWGRRLRPQLGQGSIPASLADANQRRRAAASSRAAVVGVADRHW